MRKYDRYHFEADPPEVTTVLYEFDTEDEMKESGLLLDNRRTTCFVSSGKYYVGGHFATSGPKDY